MEHEADLIIYGGTSAAVVAAVQAAQMNQSVILVSPDQHLGGMTSSGLGWTDVGNKEIIGGLAREFYRRVFLHYQKPEAWVWQSSESYGGLGQDIPAIDPEGQTMWIFEPHVAEAIFEEWLQENQIPVYREEALNRKDGVEVKRGMIASIRTLSGKIFKGEMFIDATYEGDLMAAAGVSYTVGRESCKTYEEQWNGVQMGVFHHDHYFPFLVSPYVATNAPGSGLLPRISAYAPRVQCQGDRAIQAYCFRLCMTKHAENRAPLYMSQNYDPWTYELLIRLFEGGWNEVFHKFDPIPNLKTDSNNHGPFSFDNIGMNWDYPEASYERRAEIIQEHKDYQAGLLYFIATDPRVPPDIQQEMQQWGYAKDEFTDNDHWPYQLYVREARRMLGKFVMREQDIFEPKPMTESIGMGAYMVDSHNVQRYIQCDQSVQNEGDIGIVPDQPYPIALGSIMPRLGESSNLLVPVALSASHPAFGSLRMEPVFMILAQSAATLASLAIQNNQNIHQVNYAELRDRLVNDGQVLEL